MWPLSLPGVISHPHPLTPPGPATPNPPCSMLFHICASALNAWQPPSFQLQSTGRSCKACATLLGHHYTQHEPLPADFPQHSVSLKGLNFPEKGQLSLHFAHVSLPAFSPCSSQKTFICRPWEPNKKPLPEFRAAPLDPLPTPTMNRLCTGSPRP